MLQAELKILGGKHQGKLISLNTKKFLVGREQDCHLRPNSELVSRHHCVFSVDDYTVRLRDLGSTNGTFVNGQNLRGETLLKAGDRVSIGKLELEVVIRAANQQTPPPSASPSVLRTVPTITPAEIPTQAEQTETSYELAAFPAADPANPAATLPADTAIIGPNPTQLQYPPSMAPGYPQNFPPMAPPGYGMPGGYMPPQYPQYPTPGYGQMPGYGQPMGYPMSYPAMMPMQQTYPAASVAVASPATTTPEEVEAAKPEALAVRLPNPEETGVKVAAPAPVAAGAPPKKEEKPSTTAADIIKQYMNRRS